MNYANVFGRTKKQFDMTMNREKITVADFFNSDIKYDVFFRRNQRSTTPQGKVRFFYAQSTPIDIGTIFVLNGSNFIVTSKDGIESDIYFTSLAVKCDTTFVVKSENKYIDVPMSVISDKWTVAHGSVFSMVNGAVAMLTQDNPVARCIKVNDGYYAFGGYYKVGNTFFNNGLAYFYLERQAMPHDDYKITYNGVTSFDIKDSTTYQLSYTVTNNGSVVKNPTIHYSSSDETIATVDSNGLMTMLKEGTVDITASYSTASVTTTMTIANTSAPTYTLSITSSTDTIKLGGGYKTMNCMFADKDGQDITATVIANMTTSDFVWTCFIEGTEFTNSSFVTWREGAEVNQKKIKLGSNNSYIGKMITIKCTVNGVTASKDLEMLDM